MTSTLPGAVDLLWIPLGAGDHVVRLNGKVYEAIKAFAQHRTRLALYHSALEVETREGRFVIESAPIRDERGREERGVVAEGPVGTRWAGRFRVFRYEIRRWRGGSVPDAHEAVGGPVRVVAPRGGRFDGGSTIAQFRRHGPRSPQGIIDIISPWLCGWYPRLS